MLAVLVVVPGAPAGAFSRNENGCLAGSPPDAFDLSTEQRSTVYRLYCSVFLRLPDVDGFEYWVTSAEQRGFDGRTLAGEFITSVEFQQRYGTLDDRAFLDVIYRNVLGRRSDASGYAYWAEALSRPNFGRSDLMLYFSDGDEFRQATRTVARAGTATAVSNWLPHGLTARQAADAELATGTYDPSLCSGHGGRVAWKAPPYAMRWCVDMPSSYAQAAIDGVYVHEAMHARIGALFANRDSLSPEQRAEVTRVALHDPEANEGLADYWAMRLVPGFAGNPAYARYVFNNELWDELLTEYPLGGPLP